MKMKLTSRSFCVIAAAWLAGMSCAMTAQEAKQTARGILSKVGLAVTESSFFKVEVLPENLHISRQRDGFFLQTQHPLVGSINITIGGASGNVVISTDREGLNSRGRGRTGHRKWENVNDARVELSLLCNTLSPSASAVVRDCTLSFDQPQGGGVNGGVAYMKADFLAGGLPFLDQIVGAQLRVDSQDGALIHLVMSHRLPERETSTSFQLSETSARAALVRRFPRSQGISSWIKRSGWARPPGGGVAVLAYRFDQGQASSTNRPIFVEAKTNGRIWFAGER